LSSPESWDQLLDFIVERADNFPEDYKFLPETALRIKENFLPKICDKELLKFFETGIVFTLRNHINTLIKIHTSQSFTSFDYYKFKFNLANDLRLIQKYWWQNPSKPKNVTPHSNLINSHLFDVLCNNVEITNEHAFRELFQEAINWLTAKPAELEIVHNNIDTVSQESLNNETLEVVEIEDTAFEDLQTDETVKSSIEGENSNSVQKCDQVLKYFIFEFTNSDSYIDNNNQKNFVKFIRDLKFNLLDKLKIKPLKQKIAECVLDEIEEIYKSAQNSQRIEINLPAIYDSLVGKMDLYGQFLQLYPDADFNFKLNHNEVNLKLFKFMVEAAPKL
jgi:hypothetical protein